MVSSTYERSNRKGYQRGSENERMSEYEPDRFVAREDCSTPQKTGMIRNYRKNESYDNTEYQGQGQTYGSSYKQVNPD